MTIFKKINIITMIGVILVVFAGIITNSASLVLFGEVEPPKSLLNK